MSYHPLLTIIFLFLYSSNESTTTSQIQQATAQSSCVFGVQSEHNHPQVYPSAGVSIPFKSNIIDYYTEKYLQSGLMEKLKADQQMRQKLKRSTSLQ